MQTLTMTSAPFPVLTSPPCSGVSLVIFSAVDQVFTEPAAISTIRYLAAQHVPLVLVSHRPAAAVIDLQRMYGMRRPFVCDGGAALYVPAGYFPQLMRIGTPLDGWNVVEFKSPGAGRAIRFLISLFRLCSEDALMIGLGESWDDRVLLSEVDVPVVVSCDAADQRRLVETLPDAYVTQASGAAGWNEAILGSLVE
jgi:predicted mannosyl-3-phosphoglycerate phosphatase (HAD superfamily)